MEFSKNTRIAKRNSFLGSLIKISLVLAVATIVVVMLGKIDFPSPNNQIEKVISNEKLKIVK